MSNDARACGDIVVEALLIDHGDPTRSLDWTRELARNFCKSHPEYQIRIAGSHFAAVARDLVAAVRDGHLPAIAQLSYTSIQLARDLLGKGGRPLFVPVGRAVGGRTRILGDPVTDSGILAAVRDHYTCAGELTSVPTQASTILLYANMTMLEAAGITSIPQTWSQVDMACKAVRALRNPPPYAITWPNYSWWMQHAVAAQGGLLADHDNGRSGRAERVDLASDEMMAYVRWWQRLHQDGHYLYTSGPSATDPLRIWAENFTAFATQQVAMCVSTSVLSERLAQAARDGGFVMAAGRAPHNGDVPYHGSVIGGDSLWLAAGLDEATQDGALAFIQYLNEQNNAAQRHKVMGYEPVTRASVELLGAEGWFAQRPYRRAAIDELTAARGTAHTKGAVLGDFARIREVLVAAMHDVLADGADAAIRFTQANAAAQRLLDDYSADLRSGHGPASLDVD